MDVNAPPFPWKGHVSWIALVSACARVFPTPSRGTGLEVCRLVHSYPHQKFLNCNQKAERSLLFLHRHHARLVAVFSGF